MPEKFGTYRDAAYRQWQSGTNRVGCDVNEQYHESFECRWQTRAQKELGYTHISIFCHLAEWSCNITDILSETRYDAYEFADPFCHHVLARYFTRLMMVVAEHLSELQKLIELAGTRGSTAARGQISLPSDTDWVHRFHEFVNRVCKHMAKEGNIHYCNHHLPYCFGDLQEPCQFSNPIRLSNVDLTNGDAIQYPKLSELVEGVLNAYKQVDRLLTSNESSYRKICSKFDDPRCNY